MFVVALRISWFIEGNNQVKLPKDSQIKLIVKVKTEPKISYQKQIIEVGSGQIITNLYPKYRVGESLLIDGKIDSLGKIYYPTIQKIGTAAGLGTYFSNLRETISASFQKFLPVKEATLVSGTVLGIDTIDQKFTDELIKTGTIHVVVVSGQNLMIVAGIFLSFAQFLGRRKSLILATAAVFFYAFLTGLEPPVLRASIMVLASTLAIYFGREVWPIWNLALAVLIIAFIWPNAIFEVSFQLTFAASLGIMTLGQYLLKTWQKLPFLGQNAAIAISAYIFTAPIILFHFGKIWPLAPFVNILVLEAIFPVMILGFLIALASLIFAPIAQLLAFLAYVPAFYFVKVVELFAQIPLDPITLGKSNLILLVGGYLLLLILFVVWTRKTRS